MELTDKLNGPREGKVEVIKVKGNVKLVDGKIVLYDGAKIAGYACDHNIILNCGRQAIANMQTGTIPSMPIGYIEVGFGAYGLGVQAQPKVTPPQAVATDTDLVVPGNPRQVFEIDPVHGVYVPLNNPMSRSLTVVIPSINVECFDMDKYIGISELLLRFKDYEKDGVQYRGAALAKKNKKPIELDDPELSLVIKWTLLW